MPFTVPIVAVSNPVAHVVQIVASEIAPSEAIERDFAYEDDAPSTASTTATTTTTAATTPPPAEAAAEATGEHVTAVSEEAAAGSPAHATTPAEATAAPPTAADSAAEQLVATATGAQPGTDVAGDVPVPPPPLSELGEYEPAAERSTVPDDPAPEEEEGGMVVDLRPPHVMEPFLSAMESEMQ